MTQQEILGNLPRAALENQWTNCRANTAILFSNLDRNGRVSLVIRQVKRFLVDFSQARLGDEKVATITTMFDDVETFDAFSKQARLVYLRLQDYIDDPGVSTYTYALRRVLQVERFDSQAELYIDLWVDILAGVLMAIITYEWGYQNLELWKKWMYQGRGESSISSEGFLPDPENKELRKSLWLQVADDFEMSLKK